MKILIAYDASGDSRTAIAELQSAGLPARAEASIVSVAESFLPPPAGEKSAAGGGDAGIAGYFQKYREQTERELGELERFALEAKKNLSAIFPKWNIETETSSGSAADRILAAASRFEPDLIVAGARGLTRAAGNRLGSVSPIILAEALCSVRISRAKSDMDPEKRRIAVCFDGSKDSVRAVETAAARNWPEKTEIGVFVVTDLLNALVPGRAFQVRPGFREDGSEGERKWAELLAGGALEKLRAAGLSASLHICGGNPRIVLPDKTRDWNACLIFAGAKSRAPEFSALGSVALALAARAACTVEIVR